MSDGFQRRRGGGAVATFSGFEADLLRSLASQLVELLRNETAAPMVSDDPLEQLMDFSGPTTAPEDPVLARLFPTAYLEDEDAAGEFRRFTETGLRDSKARAAGSIIEALEGAGLPAELPDGLVVDVELAPEDAMTWLRSFTDIRLALASRLGIEEGDEDVWLSMPDDDPRSHVYDIYQWVGYLQETLVAAVSR